MFPVCAEPDGVERLEAICRSQEHSRCKTLVGILLARYPRKAPFSAVFWGASLLPSSGFLSFPSPPLHTGPWRELLPMSALQMKNEHFEHEQTHSSPLRGI